MGELKSYKENSEVKFAERVINEWYKKEDSNILNIITIPYNSNIIFYKIINKLIKEKLKVLYIMNDESNIKDIINKFNIKNGENYINFISSKNINDVKNIYDLIIYDDISSYSNDIDAKIKLNIDIIYKKSKKIIVYTMEKVLNNCENIYINSINDMDHFIEPRIITTRVDLDLDIPYIMYDYIKWFKKNRRNVIIIVPTKEKVDKIYTYYIKNILKKGDVRIIKAKGERDYKGIKHLNKFKDKPLILITDYIGDYIEQSRYIDIVVYFAESKIYSYKKFLYICGKIIAKGTNTGEVLLISNKITKDIEKTQSISRGYNKLLWVKRLE